MIFFLHFMKGTLKQMSHLRFLLLLTQIKLELQKCGKISVTNACLYRFASSADGNQNTEQEDKAMWANQCKGRLTASHFFCAFTRANTIKANPPINRNVEPLLTKIMGYDASTGHNIPALHHGKKYEPIAKERYTSLKKWAIC